MRQVLLLLLLSGAFVSGCGHLKNTPEEVRWDEPSPLQNNWQGQSAVFDRKAERIR